MINAKMTVGEYKEYLDGFLDSRKLDDESIMPWPPMPLEYVDNVLRVKNNRLLKYLIEQLPGSLNTLADVARVSDSAEDHISIYRQFGYSLGGLNDLSSTPETDKDLYWDYGQKIIERREGALTRIHPANTQNTPDNLVWVGESDAAKRQED